MQGIESIEMLMMENFDGIRRKSDIRADNVFQPDDRFQGSDKLLTNLSVGTNNKDSHLLKDKNLFILITQFL